jgi:hypothetical protein
MVVKQCGVGSGCDGWRDDDRDEVYLYGDGWVKGRWSWRSVWWWMDDGWWWRSVWWWMDDVMGGKWMVMDGWWVMGENCMVMDGWWVWVTKCMMMNGWYVMGGKCMDDGCGWRSVWWWMDDEWWVTKCMLMDIKWVMGDEVYGDGWMMGDEVYGGWCIVIGDVIQSSSELVMGDGWWVTSERSTLLIQHTNLTHQPVNVSTVKAQLRRFKTTCITIMNNIWDTFKQNRSSRDYFGEFLEYFGSPNWCEGEFTRGNHWKTQFKQNPSTTKRFQRNAWLKVDSIILQADRRKNAVQERKNDFGKMRYSLHVDDS